MMEADQDGDGKLSFGEFKDMVASTDIAKQMVRFHCLVDIVQDERGADSLARDVRRRSRVRLPRFAPSLRRAGLTVSCPLPHRRHVVMTVWLSDSLMSTVRFAESEETCLRSRRVCRAASLALVCMNPCIPYPLAAASSVSLHLHDCLARTSLATRA